MPFGLAALTFSGVSSAKVPFISRPVAVGLGSATHSVASSAVLVSVADSVVV